jgi:predicted nucleic acid-binding protein
VKTLIDTSVLVVAIDPAAGERRARAVAWFEAQMWAAAHLHQVPFLLSEDMAAGATYDGVTIVDPFETPPG